MNYGYNIVRDTEPQSSNFLYDAPILPSFLWFDAKNVAITIENTTFEYNLVFGENTSAILNLV